MRGVLFYVEAGKGHYIPAKAIHESMQKLGHETLLVDLFLAVDTRFWHYFTKYIWRLMLHFPNYERKANAKNDNPTLWRKFVPWVVSRYSKRFTKWFAEVKPDFILCTHFIGGLLLPPMVKACGLDIPVYLYGADIFMSPLTGLSNELDKLYISSQFGVDWVIAHGQEAERTALCPFPLQHKFTEVTLLTKQDSRKKLNLSDKFTTLLSLGGEGIGSTDFVEKLNKRELDVQVVLVGNISQSTKIKYDAFMTAHPECDIHLAGYVENIHDYFRAADIVVGKQGANTLMEAIYMHRPCLISEVLYTAEYSARFIEEHGIGWSESDYEKQVEIIEKCMTNPQFHEDMQSKFDEIPLKFGADDFAKQIIEDTLNQRLHHQMVK